MHQFAPGNHNSLFLGSASAGQQIIAAFLKSMAFVTATHQMGAAQLASNTC
jgi:hypothetical protein